MTTKDRFKHILAWFDENMPVAESELHYRNPYELLVAVMLSDAELPHANAVLEEEFTIGKGGGIAFTLRVQSIADKRVLQFFTGETEVE